MRPQLRDVVIARERHLARQRLVEHAAECVDVGAAVDVVAPQLLGRHVVERSDPLAGRGEAALRGASLGKAEVGEVDVLPAPAGGHEHVRRLDVAVDEAALVCRVECGGHLRDHTGGPQRFEPALGGDERAQVRAVDVAHGDVEDALRLPGREDRDHIGVVEGRRETRLTHEPVAESHVVRERSGDHLEGDLSAQGDLHGAVHDTHAAAPHLVFDSEVAEGRARRKHAHPIAGVRRADYPVRWTRAPQLVKVGP